VPAAQGLEQEMPLRRDSMKRLPEDVFAEPSANRTTADGAAPIPGGVNDQVG